MQTTTSSSAASLIITSSSLLLLLAFLSIGGAANRDLDELAESASFVSLGVFRGWVGDESF